MATLSIASPSPPPTKKRRKEKATRSRRPFPEPHSRRLRSPLKTRSQLHSIPINQRAIKLSRESPPPGTCQHEMVQKSIMRMIGLVNEEVNIDGIEPVITEELAELIACANRHDYYNPLYEQYKRDGYYTKEESNKAIESVVKHGSNSIPRCKCIAHESIETFKIPHNKDLFCMLIRIPSKMNNDKGKTFIISLVSTILHYSKQTEINICCTEQGTEWSVNCMLIDPVTSETQAFRGWPDFCLSESTVNQYRRDGVPQRLLIATRDIYDWAIQIQKQKNWLYSRVQGQNRKPSSMFYCEEDIVIFQLVDSATKLDLEDPAGTFSQFLIATMQYVKE